MTLWRTYYHLVWATRDRDQLITDEIESELHRFIEAKSRSLDCPIHAIGGMADHIHLIVSVPPSRAISDFVKRIKGSSSRYINQTYPQQTFAWQKEYGVFSMGRKQLNQAISYVLCQKHHHHQQTLIQSLEPTAFRGEKTFS